MKNWKAVLLALVGAIAAVSWYMHQQPQSLSTPVAITQTQLPVPVGNLQSVGPSIEEKPSFAPIPPVDISDGAVILAANDLAPQLVQWLTPNEQVRKWVALVNQIADGKLPRNYLPLVYPMEPFRPRQHGKRWTFDNGNYQRANWLINVITQISTVKLAQAYQVWRPQLNTAYRELGGRGGFDKRLHGAIEQVLAVQPLSSTPELICPGVYFQYADPTLEQASDVKKLLWRLGPNNIERLQSFLRELDPQLRQAISANQ